MKTQAKILLAVAMLFSAGNSVASTFINVFLMRATHNSLDLVIWQNILNYLVLLLAFVSGSRLSFKISLGKIFRLGLLANMAYYLIIIVMRNHLATLVILLGIFLGLGNGLYWFSMNLLIGQLVEASHLPKFFSLQQMMAFSFGIFIPALSGFLIVKLPGLSGYYLLFALAIALLGLGVFLIGRLRTFKSDQKMQVLGILKIRKNPFWNANFMLNLSMGFKGAMTALVFVLFAYSVFKNESVVGDLTSLQAGLSAISAFLFAHLFKIRQTRTVYLLTSILSFLAYVILALMANPLALILSFAVFGLTQTWGSAIANSMNYQFSELGGAGFSRDEYIVASEFPMVLGRIVGLLSALVLERVLPSIDLTYRLIFILIAAMWLLEFGVIEQGVGWDSEKFTPVKEQSDEKIS